MRRGLTMLTIALLACGPLACGRSSAPPDAAAAAPDRERPEPAAERARRTYNAGLYADALGIAREALVKWPDDRRIRTVAGLAACRLKDAAEARTHWAALTGSQKQSVEQICRESGIPLGEGP